MRGLCSPSVALVRRLADQAGFTDAAYGLPGNTALTLLATPEEAVAVVTFDGLAAGGTAALAGGRLAMIMAVRGVTS